MSEKSSSYSVQGYNLLTLLKRLEAATSRLEDITIFQEHQTIANNGKSVADGPVADVAAAASVAAATAAAAAVAAATSATADIAASAPAEIAAPAPVSVADEPLVEGFQVFLDKFVIPFEKLSSDIHEDVAKVVGTLLKGFLAEKEFLKIVAISKPATQQALVPYISDIQKEIGEVMSYKDKYRGNFNNHVNAVNEFVAILGWVVIECMGGNNKPIISYISDINDSSKFWTNRVVKDYKDKDKTHVEWAKQMGLVYEGLKEYINEYHGTGLAWDVRDGIPIEEAYKKVKESNAKTTKSGPAPPALSGAAAPPPPPPPPPGPAPNLNYDEITASKSSTDTTGAGMNAVFADLNKGTDITKGLKKVDKSQMTHKNPELRRSGSTSSTSSSKKAAPKPPKKPTSLSSNKVKKDKPAPKKELVDSKWMIANFEDNHEIIIDGQINQSIFITRCSGCTIKVNGKVNTITVNECNKVGVVIDSLISGVEIIKTTNFQIQPLGFVPMMNIDQSHEAEIYLGKESLECQFFTSQCTSLNIYSADEKNEGEFIETPLPEQLVHTYDKKSGKFISNVVELSG